MAATTTVPLSSSPQAPKLSSLNGMPLDAFVAALSFLDRGTLGKCLAVSSEWSRLADLDAIWQPIAIDILGKRLCLLPDVHDTVATATGTSRVCRRSLASAFEDAKRCVLSVDDLADRPLSMRFMTFRNLRNLPNGFPVHVPPFRITFTRDGCVRSEQGQSFHMQMHWCFIESAHSYTSIDGGRAFDPPLSGLPPPAYSCVRCGNRPPSRVYRHPENWGVLLVSHRALAATYDLPPLGDDDFLDNMEGFLHPANFVRPPLPPAEPSSSGSSSDDDASLPRGDSERSIPASAAEDDGASDWSDDEIDF
jgi:hypothetical protein